MEEMILLVELMVGAFGPTVTVFCIAIFAYFRWIKKVNVVVVNGGKCANPVEKTGNPGGGAIDSGSQFAICSQRFDMVDAQAAASKAESRKKA